MLRSGLSSLSLLTRRAESRWKTSRHPEARRAIVVNDSIAENALSALKNENPHKAREELENLILQNPDRIDLHHALSITLLRMGEAKAAKLITSHVIAY